MTFSIIPSFKQNFMNNLQEFIFNVLTYKTAYESFYTCNNKYHSRLQFSERQRYLYRMHFYFKNAVWALMERIAQKGVQNIVYTINPVTTSMEPVPTVVKMDT